MQMVVLLILHYALLLVAAALSQPAAAVTLQFVTIARADGCPLTLYYPSNSSNQAFLAPAFCLAENTESVILTAACPRHDPVLNATYLSLPLIVTGDSRLLAVARESLGPLLMQNRTLAFLRPLSVAWNSKDGGRARVELLWEPGLEIGQLRVACSNDSCEDLRSRFADSRLGWEELEELELELELSPLSTGSQPIRLTHRISTVNRAIILTVPHSPHVLRAPLCTNLRDQQVLVLSDSCTVTVQKRSDRKGHFVIEPMLCYQGNHSVQFDEQGGGAVRLTLEVTNDRVRDSVNRMLSHLSPLSVTFMSLVGAEIHVAEPLKAWSFETIRLAPDGDRAELRVRCRSEASCRLFISILEVTPVNMWRHVRWTTEARIVGSADQCTWRTHRVTSYPMTEPEDCPAATDFYQQPPPPAPAATTETTDADAGLVGDLGGLTVRRGARSFLIVQQRLDDGVDFRRNWTEYENGFGDNNGSFWIGLRALATLGSSVERPRTLRVELIDWSGGLHVAEYANFTVGDAEDGYRANFGQMLPRASSLAGDSLGPSRGAKFSTWDADTDPNPDGSCSERHGGAGWWFGRAPCAFCNPNGAYGEPGAAGLRFVAWYHVTYRWSALMETRLMLQLLR